MQLTVQKSVNSFSGCLQNALKGLKILPQFNKLRSTAAVKAISSDWMMYHMRLPNRNQPIMSLEQRVFQKRLYRELEAFAGSGVCITLNGQAGVPLEDIADLCVIRQPGLYYARKEYDDAGKLQGVHFVLYDRRHDMK